MTDIKVIELINAYKSGAPKEALEKRKQVDQETQDFLDKNLLNARYDHWVKMAYWSTKEAEALFAGFEPHLMTRSDFPNTVKTGLFLRIEQHHEAFKRAVGAFQLDESDTPQAYLKWAKRLNIKIPAELEILVGLPEPKAKAPKEKSLGTRERETLLKIIIGMAIEGYRYNPGAAKNTAVSEIANDLEKLGITVSDDTVRKWLNEGAELLPQEAEKA
jgi:hypothetical protein